MSKDACIKKIIIGLALFSVLFIVAEFCLAEDSGTDAQIGRNNPFEVIAPEKVVDEKIIEEVVESVRHEGITQEQLQAAIKAAVEAAVKSIPKQVAVRQPVAVQQKPVEVVPVKIIKSIMLKFLRAESVLPVVQSMLTKYGTVSVDKETNTLIICDSKENLARIFVEVTIADQTPRQVLVEVVIIDVQLSNDTELGVNWDNLFRAGGELLGSVSYAQKLTDLTSGGSLTMVRGRMENTIKALQKERNTEILASPRVLVLSGQKAHLETIEEVPYTDLTQTGNGGGVGNPIASTSFKKAGITLTVKPTITDEGMIMIEVEPDQSINTGIAGVGATSVPIIDRRTMKTTLLMKEGEIAVIGGLRSKDIRIIQDKIPLLGDLPLIGGLFSNDKEVIENSELLILIAPHIYSSEDGLEAQEQALWKEAMTLPSLRLRRKVRPEQELVKKIIPQNKPEKL